MKVTELKYSNTNTWLIRSEKGVLLFDTGWAGSFEAFLKAMGEQKETVQDIDCILISHFHPDHCGIAQEIAALGPQIVVCDVQKDHIHFADKIFASEKKFRHIPIDDEKIRILPLSESRQFLKSLGLEGEILHTPGHSDDSISLCLDEGSFFVGDLNPLYELELHRGTEIGKSWEKLLERKPHSVYYGHARTAQLTEEESVLTESRNGGKGKPADEGIPLSEGNLYQLVKRIMKDIDKDIPLDRIAKKTGAPVPFVQNVARMYLTHQNVGVQGILDRIELRSFHTV